MYYINGLFIIHLFIAPERSYMYTALDKLIKIKRTVIFKQYPLRRLYMYNLDAHAVIDRLVKN